MYALDTSSSNSLEGRLEAMSSSSNPTFGDLSPYFADVDRVHPLEGPSMDHFDVSSGPFVLFWMFLSLLILGVLEKIMIILL